MSTLRQTPLTCSGHTRPVVFLAFSDVNEDGLYFSISACKGTKSTGPLPHCIGPNNGSPLGSLVVNLVHDFSFKSNTIRLSIQTILFWKSKVMHYAVWPRDRGQIWAYLPNSAAAFFHNLAHRIFHLKCFLFLIQLIHTFARWKSSESVQWKSCINFLKSILTK